VSRPGYLLNLGLTPYREAWDLQRSIAAGVSQGAIPDTVIMLEHPPVVTLGRRTDEQELHVPEGAEVEVVETDRGGKSTFHGPGQLVCYPILDLRDHGKDLRRYAHDLERVVIEALAELGIAAVAGEDREHVGVWVGDRKIASLGIRVDSWVARHGFALNVDCDLDAFARFRACGLDATPFTSVARELGRDVGVADARGPVLDALARVFSLELSAIPV
jgi:lipoate-protein ligase B